MDVASELITSGLFSSMVNIFFVFVFSAMLDDLQSDVDGRFAMLLATTIDVYLSALGSNMQARHGEVLWRGRWSLPR
jgi:uncharacterized membrane protein YvlD (DUF360 family)